MGREDADPQRQLEAFHAKGVASFLEQMRETRAAIGVSRRLRPDGTVYHDFTALSQEQILRRVASPSSMVDDTQRQEAAGVLKTKLEQSVDLKPEDFGEQREAWIIRGATFSAGEQERQKARLVLGLLNSIEPAWPESDGTPTKPHPDEAAITYLELYWKQRQQSLVGRHLFGANNKQAQEVLQFLDEQKRARQPRG